jgi:M61 glycyl aminopeptidase
MPTVRRRRVTAPRRSFAWSADVIRARARNLIVALAALSACGGRAAPPRDPSTAKAGLGPRARHLSLALELESRTLHVRIEASGTPEDMRAWKLGDDVDRIEVLDTAGRPLTFRRDGHRIEIDGGAASVVVRYDLASVDRPLVAGQDYEDARITLLDPNRFRGIGERILALPEAFEAKAVPVSIEQRSSAPALVVGSSFGIGIARIARQLEVPGSVLRRAVYVTGPGGRAEFDAPEGHDESAWLGYTAFDPRSVSAEVAGFRGVLHEYFKVIELPPATLFFTVDVRPRGRFRVVRTQSGVLVALSGVDPFDAALRLAVGHELVHAWIGERIWLGDASPGHEAASYWFHEGVTRWVAREQLARVGLLSSDEYAAEVNRVLAIVTTSRHAARPMESLLADPAATGVVPLLVSRGTLFATAVDARIRETSHGKRSFDDVLRALMVRAEERRGPLPAAAIDELLSTELGAAHARNDLEDFVLVGRKKKLPEAALGGCFEPTEIAYESYEPGFDVAGSRTAHAIVGVDAKGPAFAAGLRNGDVRVAGEVPERADQTAKLELERDGRPVAITYRPTSGPRRGQGFRRKAGLSEEACRKLALRK